MTNEDSMAIAQGITSVANTIATAGTNRRDRKFTRQMYEKQKKDNIAFWNMQNTYNSPQEQMKRLQAAGLNPNLVYGDGATGNVATAPDSAQPKEFSQTAPQLENPASAYFSLKAQQAQLDNMKLQNDLLAQKKLMNEIDYDLPTYDMYKNASDAYGQNSQGRRADKLQADSEKAQYEKGISRIRYELDKTNQPVNVKTVLQKFLNLEQDGKKSQAETSRINSAKKVLDNQAILQEFEKMLNEGGIDRNSPFYIKWIITQLDKFNF